MAQRSKQSFSSVLDGHSHSSSQHTVGHGHGPHSHSVVASPRSEAAMARVDVESRGRATSFTSNHSTPTSPTSPSGSKVGPGGKPKSVSRTVSSFFKQLFKSSQDGSGPDGPSPSNKSSTSATRAPEADATSQAKRLSSIKTPALTTTSSSSTAVASSSQVPAAAAAAAVPKKPAASQPSTSSSQHTAAAPAAATAAAPARAPADKTVLLALSPSLPPSMQRASWSLKDYAVVEKMYTGYASTVYKAWCKHSGETVCLKAYNMANLCELNRFQIYREVKLHSSLQHENIITLFAAFQQGDQVVLVQEYADAGDLFLLLHRYGGKLPERTAVEMVLHPFLCVLNYLHQNMVVHRDIKPENVLFTRTMALKLCDFGLAIDLKEERAVTRAGTLEYMAPEVLNCPFKNKPEENKDNQSLYYDLMVDTWAVGVLTYELLVGFPPFNDKQRAAIEDKIRMETPRFPSSMSELARNFIMRALQKDAMDRPSIMELLQHPWIKAHRRNASMRTLNSSQQAARPRAAAKPRAVPEEGGAGGDGHDEDAVPEMRGPAGDLIRHMPATMSFTVGHAKPRNPLPENSHMSFSSQANPKLAALRAGVL